MSGTCPPLPPFLNSLLSADLPLSLSLCYPTVPSPRAAARVFPFSLTLLVYFFLLSSPRAYVTASSLSHRNRQHCYTLLGITTSSSFCFKTLRASSQSTFYALFDHLAWFLTLSLSFSRSLVRYDACRIDPRVLSAFLSLSPPACSILSRALLPYERSILPVLFSSFAAHAFSPLFPSSSDSPSPAFGHLPFSRLVVPFLPLSALLTFFHLPRYLLTVAMASREDDLTYLPRHLSPSPLQHTPSLFRLNSRLSCSILARSFSRLSW